VKKILSIFCSLGLLFDYNMPSDGKSICRTGSLSMPVRHRNGSQMPNSVCSSAGACIWFRRGLQKAKYAEWCRYWLQEKSLQGKVHDFLVRTYGKNFEFKDFAPMFKAELRDPDEWADLLEKAGGKYIAFTTEMISHNGILLPCRPTTGLHLCPAEVPGKACKPPTIFGSLDLRPFSPYPHRDLRRHIRGN